MASDSEGSHEPRDDEPPPAAKRLKQDEAESSSAFSFLPRTFVTWNCNGFTSRCKYNEESLRDLLSQTGHPDVLCLQEVRLKAAAAGNRGQPLDWNGSVEQRVLTQVFGDYTPYWSLADTKYAGSLTLIHRRVVQSQGETVAAAFSFESAVNLLLQKFDLTRDECGLKGEAAAAAAAKPKDKKQSSMKSFFAPKAPAKPSLKSHHPEGRVQFFRFPGGMDLIQTYVPNHGDRPEKWERRREWDGAMRDFLVARRKIYQTAGKAPPVLLWCGDMNVAVDHRDGTHWERRSNGTGIYEWWTDESKCFISRQKIPSDKHPDHVGMPSFTPAERRRFGSMLQEADLCDVWRKLHPDGANVLPQYEQSPWEQPNWTWRGHLSQNNNGGKGKYQGKGQRLDYFLLSPASAADALVESCDILGHGERRDGLFCGSDHCAVSLSLKPTEDMNL